VNELGRGFEHRVLAEQERLWLAARAGAVARAAGFDARMQARVGLCVSELVSNAARHAGGGVLRVFVLSEPALRLEIVMEDDGPGIALPELALHDGFSEGRFIAPDDPPRSRRGLGTGLGALARLSSGLRLTQREGGGTRVELQFVASDRR